MKLFWLRASLGQSVSLTGPHPLCSHPHGQVKRALDLEAGMEYMLPVVHELDLVLHMVQWGQDANWTNPLCYLQHQVQPVHPVLAL